MTFVAHFVRKDLRAVALVAVFWIFLMSLELAVQLTGAFATLRVPTRPTLASMLLGLLPFAEVLTAALIVSLVIHEDPLVDTRAFWLTRPIPRGQFFLAKLTTIGLVIFAPALTAFGIVLAWYHVPPVYMMRASFEIMLWLAFPLLFFTAAATLTSTPTRYVVALFGLLVTTITLFGLRETFRTPVPAGVVFETRLPLFNDPARQVTIALILIAGYCAALYQFYRRRHWLAALFAFTLIFGLATGVARYAPRFRFFAPLGEAAGAWTDPSRTRLRLLDLQPQVSAYYPRELRSVSAPIVLDGLPDGYTATPFTLSGELTRADGTVLRSGRTGAMQVEARGEYQPSLTLTYRNDPIDAGPTKWEAWPVLLELPSGHRGAMRAEVQGDVKGDVHGGAARAGEPEAEPEGGPAYYAGTYTGTFLYRIARHEKVATLRLDRREGYTDGPRGIRVVEAEDLYSSCRVTVEVTNVELTLAGPREPTAGYYFVDRQSGTRLRAARRMTKAGLLGPLQVGLAPGRRIFTTAQVEWEVESLRYGAIGGAAISGAGQTHTPACAGSDLIFVRTIAEGSLTRTITLPDFRVSPSQDTFFRR